MDIIKKIIWIDDREDEMEQVLRGAFIELWKRNILSQVVFFGNAYPKFVCQDSQWFSNLIVDVFLAFFTEYII